MSSCPALSTITQVFVAIVVAIMAAAVAAAAAALFNSLRKYYKLKVQ